jgi:hypothetical protein
MKEFLDSLVGKPLEECLELVRKERINYEYLEANEEEYAAIDFCDDGYMLVFDDELIADGLWSM